MKTCRVFIVDANGRSGEGLMITTIWNISSSSPHHRLDKVAAVLSTPEGRVGARSGRGVGRAIWSAYALIPFQQAEQQLATHSTTLGAFWVGREGGQHSSIARAIKAAAQHQRPLGP